MFHDLRLELRARNNVLWHAIFDVYPSVAEFCRHHGFQQCLVGEYLNLRRSPYKATTGDVRADARRLCDVTGLGPDELWPPDLYRGLIPSRAVAEISSTQYASLAAARRLALPPSQESEVMAEEQRQALEEVLQTLSPREAEILRRRFGFTGEDDQTLDEVAQALGRSRGRIDQLELRALSRLRRGSKIRRLRQVYEPTPEKDDETEP